MTLPVFLPSEEYVTAQFRLEGGAIGTMNQSAVARGMPSVYKIDFVGDKGSVRLDVAAGTCTLLDATGKVQKKLGYPGYCSTPRMTSGPASATFLQ